MLNESPTLETSLKIISDMNNLYPAYIASKRNSSWKQESQQFEINWLVELSKLQQQLQDNSYKTSRGTVFKINERGKTRKIVGGRIVDRIVRHSFCDNILMPYAQRYLIYDNAASQKGKGIDFTRNRLLEHLRNYYYHFGNKGYILLMDFSKYYDNIQHTKVLDLFTNLDEYSSKLLKTILDNFKIDVSYMTDEEYCNCLYTKYDSLKSPESNKKEKFMDKSVDIGDQTSQVIGIYYPTKLDNYVKIVNSQKYYGRYMDDSYIISNNKDTLHKLLKGLLDIAKNLGIFINLKKTQILRLDKGFTFLQNNYRITETGKIIIKVNKKRLTTMRRRIKKLATKKLLTLELFKSWFCGFYKIMSNKQKESLCRLFLKLYNINSIGKELNNV